MFAGLRMRSSSVSAGSPVVPFPLSRRLRQVRECAVTLDAKQGKEAETYWKGHCRSMAERLVALGCSKEEASRQVMEFHHSVQLELMSLHEERAAFGSQQA